MIRENREYRQAAVEFRAAEDREYFVEGYASTFDPYKMYTINNIDYYEKIDRNAFDNTDMTDVVLLCDHEGKVYARTKNNTLTLEVDEKGLKVTADLSKTAAGREAYEEIKAGMYSQMSFAFVSIKEKEEYDKAAHCRNIKDVRKLYDVSFVTRPANYFTDIVPKTRSIFDGYIEEELLELAEKEKELELARARFYFEKEKKNGN